MVCMWCAYMRYMDCVCMQHMDCVCAVYGLCAYVYTYAGMHRGSGRMLVPCSIPLPYFLDTGLSLNLQRCWQPESPVIILFPPSPHWGYEGQCGHTGCYVDSEIQTQVLVFAQQVLSPTEPSSKLSAVF